MTTPRDNATGISSDLTRRRLMQIGGGGALALSMGGLLSACGSDSDSGGTSGGGTPTPGGTLRVGATSGGDTDSIDAQNSLTTVDFIRAGALFEQLMIMDPKTGQPTPVLAESVEPNKDATEWTISLRSGVTFHDGKPFEAKDVLYSLKRIEKNEFPGLINLGPIDLKASKAVDAQTVLLKFKSSYAILPDALAGSFTIRMVPVGYDPKTPVGTGPFKYKSFSPGARSTFVRNENYWQEGKPYLDALTVINFADETAQVNALQAGQVDLIDQLSYTSIAPVESTGGKIMTSETAAFVPMYMRTDKAPFSDVRVRQALRLSVNREEYNAQIFGGKGTIGNDIFGAIDPEYKEIPQREQDIEQAKSLLKAAGQSDLRISLYAAATGPGAEAGAAVFATQAKEAGITVKVVKQPATQYWAQSYAKVPFGLSFWNVSSYLVESGQGVTKGAPYNEIQQTNAKWQGLYDEALKTVDTAARGELVKQLMTFDHNQGGYIIPVNFPTIEGMSSKVNGVRQDLSGFPMNGSNGLQDIWIQS